MKQINVTVSGPSDSGKTTIAFLLKQFLIEHGFSVEANYLDGDAEYMIEDSLEDRMDIILENVGKVNIIEAREPVRSVK